MIIENPYAQPHFLTNYWCIEPSIIDMDRTLNGDYFKKPTQYFFINIEPKNNEIEPLLEFKDRKIITKVKGNDNVRRRLRSEISSDYANRFIRRYIL